MKKITIDRLCDMAIGAIITMLLIGSYAIGKAAGFNQCEETHSVSLTKE